MADAKNVVTGGIGANPGGLMWFLTGGLDAGAVVIVDVTAISVTTVAARRRTTTVDRPRTTTAASRLRVTVAREED